MFRYSFLLLLIGVLLTTLAFVPRSPVSKVPSRMYAAWMNRYYGALNNAANGALPTADRDDFVANLLDNYFMEDALVDLSALGDRRAQHGGTPRVPAREYVQGLALENSQGKPGFSFQITEPVEVQMLDGKIEARVMGMHTVRGRSYAITYLLRVSSLTPERVRAKVLSVHSTSQMIPSSKPKKSEAASASDPFPSGDGDKSPPGDEVIAEPSRTSTTESLYDIRQPLYTTIKSNGQLWQTPNQLGNRIKSVSRGEKVKVIGLDGDFWKVNVDGRIGYIHNVTINVNFQMREIKQRVSPSSSDGHVSPSPGRNTSSPIYTTTNMNGQLWKRPSQTGDRIRSLKKGSRLQVLDREGDFWKVRSNGTVGYAHKVILNITPAMQRL